MPDRANQQRVEFTRHMVRQEVDTAEAFVARELSEEPVGEIPSALLVMGEQRGRKSILDFLLEPMTNIPSVSAAMLTGSLAEIGETVGKRQNWHPLCVISMVELVELTLEEWVLELQERSGSEVREVDFNSKRSLAITAADAAGYQLRRVYPIETATAPKSAYRQLGQSREVESVGEVSEMDRFWQAFKAARVKSSGQGFG